MIFLFPLTILNFHCMLLLSQDMVDLCKQNLEIKDFQMKNPQNLCCKIQYQYSVIGIYIYIYIAPHIVIESPQTKWQIKLLLFIKSDLICKTMANKYIQ